ncbi:hypothetical protein [Chitinophaga niabensis]|uniref:Uncharacterized protein n=1 Tax=Chitinophaga niabensis TaxID=536979 RepID=A0A1N6G6Q0_9BACT|nr:hypothetical protein [Chitinophaga niabensis]SIO03177.1 hypothetical protein SAMN04488055_2609 [Chitinophaga niabensis]
MKKNILALVAVVAAVTLSSFTTQRAVSYFLVYDVVGLDDQAEVASYTSQELVQPAFEDGTGVLNWIRVEDTSLSNAIEDNELATALSAYDTGTAGTLDDQIDSPSGDYDVKDL